MIMGFIVFNTFNRFILMEKVQYGTGVPITVTTLNDSCEFDSQLGELSIFISSLW